MVRLGRSRGRRADLSRRRHRIVCGRRWADHLWRLVLSENETAADHHMKTKILLALLLFYLFARWPGAGVSVLLRREGRKIDRAHGGRDLVSVRRCDVGPGWDRSIQFPPLATWAHACRAASGNHRGRFEQI